MYPEDFLVTYNFFVYFGPRGTVYIRAPGITPMNFLPGSLQVHQVFDKATRIEWIAYPPVRSDLEDIPDPCFCYSETTFKDSIGQWSSLSQWKTQFTFPLYFSDTAARAYPDLKQWAQSRYGHYDVEVLADNNGGCWGNSNLSGKMFFKNLPGDLTQKLKWKDDCRGRVVHSAIGAGGAYVVIFKNGQVEYDLKGQFKGLEMHLQDKQSRILYISMSLFDDDVYFVAYENGTVLYDFPPDEDGTSIWPDIEHAIIDSPKLRILSEKMEAVRTTLRTENQRISTPVPATMPVPVPAAETTTTTGETTTATEETTTTPAEIPAPPLKRKDSLERFMDKLGDAVFNAGVSQAFSALIGSSGS